MTDDRGSGVVELNGVWLSKGGELVRVAGSLLNEEFADEDQLKAENDQVGERHRHSLIELKKGTNNEDFANTADDGVDDVYQSRKKVLEIVTDSPGSIIGHQRGSGSAGAHGLMAGVMGWEYLLGEMFGADHVGIGVDGMCLTQDCVGGRGHPAGMGDAFFRR